MSIGGGLTGFKYRGNHESPVVDVTLAQLRELRQRLDRERAAAAQEREQLEFGRRAVDERLRELTRIDFRLRDLDYSVGHAIVELGRQPRGTRLAFAAPTLPVYNPHRRLAVMSRGF